MYQLAHGIVAQELGGEHAAFEVAGFQIVVAVEVGGDAYGGSFEVNSGKGDAFAVLVYDTAADFCRLPQTDNAQ